MYPSPAFALRDPAGSKDEVGKGKYDTPMDPLVAAARYGSGKTQGDARKELKKEGKAVPARFN